MPLSVGATAPEWSLLAAHNNAISQVSLRSLLDPHKALVLTTFPLDFTGG
ncbi:MAG TPA: hypothetical protein VFB34_07235 [Chloroflexota bacterium]|nr:hypothetical protein [Chloroflexota bacterium]